MIFGPTKMTFPHDDNVAKINIPMNRIGDDDNETSVKFLGIGHLYIYSPIFRFQSNVQ